MIKKLGVMSLVAVAVTALGGAAQAGPTLDKVKQAGQISCGVPTGIAGFAAARQPGPLGRLRCRCLQGAVGGDLRRRRQGQICAADRAAALHRAAIGRGRRPVEQHDRTLQRDTELGLNFAPVVFYDGQGFMVPKKLGVKSAKELNGATICVAARDDDRAQSRRLLPRQQDGVQAGRHREGRRALCRVLLRPLRCDDRRRLGAGGAARRAGEQPRRLRRSCPSASRRSRWPRSCARATTNGTTSSTGWSLR